MRRFTLHVAVLFLSFTVGLLATAAWLYLRQAITNKPNPSQTILSAPPKQRTVVSSVEGDTLGTDGYHHSFSNYEYSDGVSVQQTSDCYKSPERANAELRKRLIQAKEIIRREPVFDERGRQTGERVVAIFVPYETSSVASAELLWTEGSRFVTHRGCSLKHIMDDLDSHR